MRASAEVHELAVAIRGDRLALLGELLNEVDFHEVAFRAEARQPLIAWDKFALKLFVARGHFTHALLDPLQVFRRERRGPEEVIEEAALRRRAMAQLGFRKKLKYGGRQHMGGRMPVNVQRVGIALRKQP